MTTVEKAKAYAERVKDDFCKEQFADLHLDRLGWECEDAYLAGYKEASKDAKKTIKDTKHGCRFAYRKGAAEALRSQWKDVSKELPKPKQDVIVAYEQYGTFDYAYAWLSVLSNGTVAWYSNDDDIQPDYIRFWLPIPPIPNTEEQ